tara:strand:- start:492 stop:650 length:159 start_codon:yes stop_codon:yes gene_type:complete
MVDLFFDTSGIAFEGDAFLLPASQKAQCDAKTMIVFFADSYSMADSFNYNFH